MFYFWGVCIWGFNLFFQLHEVQDGSDVFVPPNFVAMECLRLTVPDPHTGIVEYSTGWIEGAAILISVTVVVLVTATNNYSKALKFAELSAETSKRSCNVLRDGCKQTIDTTELVVGDVLFLNAGDLLPADAILVEGVEVKCDEAAVTGESDVVDKDAELDPFLVVA